MSGNSASEVGEKSGEKGPNSLKSVGQVGGSEFV